jgi:hypothetical protein
VVQRRHDDHLKELNLNAEQSRVVPDCHRQWETDPPGTLNLTHRFRWFLREGGADAEVGGADGTDGSE